MTGGSRVGSALRAVARWPRRLLLLPVLAYQRGISPYTPPACRYTPVCSEYGREALHVHGAVKGLLLTGHRIVRCNPFTAGGLDPVPAPGMWANPRRIRAPRTEGLPLTETPDQSRHHA